MMWGESAAHRVEVHGDTRGHNDRLRVEIGQIAGSSVNDKDADKQDDSRHCTGFRAVVAAGHPGWAHRIALNNRRELGDATHR